MQQAQLFWDGEGDAAGWMFRYVDAAGAGQEIEVEQAKDATVQELTVALEDALAPDSCLTGKVVVLRDRGVRGDIWLVNGSANAWVVR